MHCLKSAQTIFRPSSLSRAGFRWFSILNPTLKVKNPYNQEVIYEYHNKTDAEMHTIVKDVFQSHRNWKRVPLEERIKVVQKAAEYFAINQDAIAKDITLQMGKPIAQSVAEMKGFQNVAKKLIEIAPEALADKVIKENQNGLLKYTREPKGVAAIFSPWNYPVLTCANLVIPSVLSGNGVVIKHSPVTPLIAKHFEESFKQAGVENIVRDLMIAPEHAADLYKMPEVGFIGFTGSAEVGRSVQDEITTNRFVDYTLELGGNSAAYVAEDADVELAAKEIITGAFYNAGQSCNAVARVYIHSSIYQDFIDQAILQIVTYKMGDPLLEDTTLGPLALAEKPETLKQQVEEAAAQGARIIIGGLPTTDSEGKGRFFEPTLIADAQNDMGFMMVETFGPLLGLAPTEGDEEVIKLINDDQYGLTAAVFSKDKERIMRLAPRLNVGTVYGNRVIHVDPHLPWSGRKNSGVGVSLSVLGFHAVTQPKSYNLRFIH